MLGKHFSVLIDESALPEVARRWQEIVSDPSVEQQVRFQERRRDGTLNAVEVHAAAIVRDGVFSGIHGASRDVSRHERMERDLRAQAAQLAANEERAHLARELHDSVTQALFSMALTSRSVELLMDRDLTAARQRLAELSELQRDALAEMRSLIFELRPGSLERDGLVQALRTHATAIEGRTGLSILVEAGDVAGRLPLAIEDTLYRIAQEALHNVVKHAAAHNVALRLRDGSGVARLGIEDDGTGFDPALVPPGRLGLAGMRTRAERLGGSLEVSSRPGAGTRVEVALPLERPVA